MWNWIETAEKIYNQRGYLVIASVSSCRPRTIVQTVNLYDTGTQMLPQPFSVICETTYEDFVAQHKLAGVPIEPYNEPRRFYRLMTD
jgi:hypothetical protein